MAKNRKRGKAKKTSKKKQIKVTSKVKNKVKLVSPPPEKKEPGLVRQIIDLFIKKYAA